MSERSDIRLLKVVMLAIWSSGSRYSPIKRVILKSLPINQGALVHLAIACISSQSLGHSVLAQGPYTEEMVGLYYFPVSVT